MGRFKDNLAVAVNLHQLSAPTIADRLTVARGLATLIQEIQERLLEIREALDGLGALPEFSEAEKREILAALKYEVEAIKQDVTLIFSVALGEN